MSTGLVPFIVIAVVADFSIPLLLLLLISMVGYNFPGSFAFGFLFCLWIFDLLSKRFFNLSDGRFVNGWRYYFIEDLPRFHNFLNRLCGKLETLHFPEMLGFSGELNCFSGYRFPLGPLRRPVRVLLIGKPTLDFLTEREIECVFAHELSHSPSRLAAQIHCWAYDKSVIQWLDFVSRFLFPLRKLFYYFVMKIQSKTTLQRDEIVADTNAKEIVGEEFFYAATAKMEVMNSIYRHELPSRLWAEIEKTPDAILNYLGFVRHALADTEFDAGRLHKVLADNRKSPSPALGESASKLLDLNSGQSLFDPDSRLIDEQLNHYFEETARAAWKAWNCFLAERESLTLVTQNATIVRDRMLW